MNTRNSYWLGCYSYHMDYSPRIRLWQYPMQVKRNQTKQIFLLVVKICTKLMVIMVQTNKVAIGILQSNILVRNNTMIDETPPITRDSLYHYAK